MRLTFWIRQEALDQLRQTGFAQAHLRTAKPRRGDSIWVQLEAEVADVTKVGR